MHHTYQQRLLLFSLPSKQIIIIMKDGNNNNIWGDKDLSWETLNTS